MTIILASQSPRRKELMKLIGMDFTVMPADIDETVQGKIFPKEYVLEMAQKKAQFVSKQNPHQLVIGCDTIVAVDDEILGKPVNDEEAIRVLKKLSNRTHDVHTAIFMMNENQIEQKIVSTEVTFFELSEEEILEYIETKEHRDKAGSYGIQGHGSLLVESVKGDYLAVVGFPVAQVKRMLQRMTN